MNIKQIPTGKWKENCYIISKSTGEAIIIDPGDDKHKIVKYLDGNDFKVSAILNTHAHYDHIGAVKYLKDKYYSPFFLHSADEKLLRSANLYVKLFDGTDLIGIPSVDYFYDKSNVQLRMYTLSLGCKYNSIVTSFKFNSFKSIKPPSDSLRSLSICTIANVTSDAVTDEIEINS